MKKTFGMVSVFVMVLLLGAFAADVSAGTLYAVRETDDHLVSIDTVTLAYTDIGALGTGFAFGGLARDPNSQTLYMIGGRGNNSLYTVNITTGQATLVGSHGINDLFGLAFDSLNNVLYASQGSASNLYSLNTITGAATLIGSMGASIGGLTYNSATDTLIGINDGGGDLYSINRANAAQTLLFNGAFTNNSGLAYAADSNLYWDIDWDGNLYSYDPANGYARATVLSGLVSHDGLEYVGAAPVAPAVPGTSGNPIFLPFPAICGVPGASFPCSFTGPALQ